MIVFTDENRKIVYSIECESAKTVSFLLPFTPKTKRFLTAYYDLLASSIEFKESTVNLQDKSVEELRAIIDSSKISYELFEELVYILKLEEEYEAGYLSLADIQIIFGYIIAQTQNQTPKNIEKKTVRVKN